MRLVICRCVNLPLYMPDAHFHRSGLPFMRLVNVLYSAFLVALTQVTPGLAQFSGQAWKGRRELTLHFRQFNPVTTDAPYIDAMFLAAPRRANNSRAHRPGRIPSSPQPSSSCAINELISAVRYVSNLLCPPLSAAVRQFHGCSSPPAFCIIIPQRLLQPAANIRSINWSMQTVHEMY